MVRSHAGAAQTGKVIRTWRAEELRMGSLTWSPSRSGQASGTYYLKLTLGNRHYSHTVHFGK